MALNPLFNLAEQMKQHGQPTNHLVSYDLNSINTSLLNSAHLYHPTNPIPPTPTLHDQMSIKDDDMDTDTDSLDLRCSASTATMHAFLHSVQEMNLQAFNEWVSKL